MVRRWIVALLCGDGMQASHALDNQTPPSLEWILYCTKALRGVLIQNATWK